MPLDARLDVGLDGGAQAGHHRGDDDVARRLGEREVQLGVEREELVGGQVCGIHRLDHGVRGVGGPIGIGGERLDDGAFEHEPRADDVVEREAAGGHLQAQQRRHAALRGGDDDGAGCRSRAGPGADESHHLEDAQRLAHAGAADAEGRGELALAGEPIAGGEAAVEEVGLDALEHHLPRARRRRCLVHEASPVV